MQRDFSPLPPLSRLEEQYPSSPSFRNVVKRHRERATRLLNGGEERRLVLFVGPCSIHDEKLALEYALRLRSLRKRVDSRIFIVMRAFLEKPRTLSGWKGYLYDPDLDGTYDVEKGIIRSRLLLSRLTELGIPLATEFLDPFLAGYYAEFVTWGVIGARTSSSQVHRGLASSLPMPVGFKNDTNGATVPAICGALAARNRQTVIGSDREGRVGMIDASGNQATHLILRGSERDSNYDPLSVTEAVKTSLHYGLRTPLVIDCSHGNSGRRPDRQKGVFRACLRRITSGESRICGMMLESHLHPGNDSSITDPCIGWEETEELVSEAFDLLRPHRSRDQPKKRPSTLSTPSLPQRETIS
ncbi:MAG: 3-deoxy-7-phosphoheptulonate synthase [Simkaniaceae bacterium]|nr:3-deoxy-7-phosphoheptulonate synthase [Simkaniaceae bacterium]